MKWETWKRNAGEQGENGEKIKLTIHFQIYNEQTKMYYNTNKRARTLHFSIISLKTIRTIWSPFLKTTYFINTLTNLACILQFLHAGSLQTTSVTKLVLLYAIFHLSQMLIKFVEHSFYLRKHFYSRVLSWLMQWYLVVFSLKYMSFRSNSHFTF